MLIFSTIYVFPRQKIRLPQIKLGSDVGFLPINQWLAVGPFAADTDILGYDYGRPHGIDEVSMGNPDALAKWLKQLQDRREKGNNPSPTLTLYKSDGYLDILHQSNAIFSRNDPVKIVYLLTELHAAEDGPMYLAFGNDDRSKVILNGELISTTSLMQEIYAETAPLRLDLKKGRNVLCIKAPNDNTDWVVFACVYSHRQHAELDRLRKNRLIFTTTVTESDAFEVSFGALWNDQANTISVTRLTDPQASVSFERRDGTLYIPRTELDGVLRVTMKVGSEEFEEMVYAGDPQRFWREWTKVYEKKLLTGDLTPHLEALAKRLVVLFKPDNYKPADAWWGRKFVHLLVELRQLESIRAPRGLQIRGFYSNIDGAHQTYRIYLPEKRTTSEPLPLIVILPTPTSAQRPFVESAFMASHREAIEFGRIAEDEQVAVLWPGYRNPPNNYPADLAHFMEVLADVKKDYVFDPGRMSIIGVCGGGVYAAKYASVWPGAFNAIGFITPTFTRGSHELDGSPAMLATKEYGEFYVASNAEEALAQKFKYPIRIVHDGAELGHGDLAESTRFVALRREFGNPIELEQPAKKLGYRMSAFRDIISWLAAQKRAAGGAFSRTAINITGSLSNVNEVVAEPCILVLPTGGSEAEKREAEKLASRFREAWSKFNFGACREICDRDLSTDMEKKYNLLLIGNGRANLAWQRLSSSASVRVAADGVTVKGRVVPGAGLSVVAVAAHPEMAERRVVFIGADDLSTAVFPSLNLSAAGWFSAMVARADGTLTLWRD